jgi:hypothetical protein
MNIPLDYIKNSVEKLGTEVVADFIKQLLAANKSATGDLIKSVRYEVLETANGIMLNIIASDYFKFVDEGRKPGGKMPPPDKILGWVKAKSISFGRNGIDFKPQQIAFIISKSIQKNGIKPTNIKQKIIDNIYKSKEEILRNGLKIDIQTYINKEILK